MPRYFSGRAPVYGQVKAPSNDCEEVAGSDPYRWLIVMNKSHIESSLLFLIKPQIFNFIKINVGTKFYKLTLI